jgi:hypothetical protein
MDLVSFALHTFSLLHVQNVLLGPEGMQTGPGGGYHRMGEVMCE